MREILQIMRLLLFERTSLDKLLTLAVERPNRLGSAARLTLFGERSDSGETGHTQ